jgi:excinuclease ABC subunit C
VRDDLFGKYERVPPAPGVYIMKDDAGRIIYIGKARNLKKRLAAYFAGTGRRDRKTAVLVRRIDAFEIVLTDTEKEALILESNLIKKHKPRYNVILKDDKRYPSLRLDTRHPYPTICIVRKTPPDGALYFGPFTAAQSVRRTLHFIHKTFKLRKCREKTFRNRTRPCLNYQMGLCLGPCCFDVPPERYRKIVDEVVLFLQGRTPDLIRQVREAMRKAAAGQEFEAAAEMRDKMFALEKTLEKQAMVNTDFQDRDLFAVAVAEGFGLVGRMRMRGGFLGGTRFFEFRETFSTMAELLGTSIRQYYENEPVIPGEILVPQLPEDVRLLEETLQNIRGRRVAIRMPRRGEKHRLLRMAVQNTENEIRERRIAMDGDRRMLSRLQKKLRLVRLPSRIECYDNSNIGGTQPVAAMAVFTGGRPDRAAGRRFVIETVDGPDDYATMREVLHRRFSGSLSAETPPDLLMVDGGRGQLGIAVKALEEMQRRGEFDVIAIAKKDEKKGESRDKIFVPGRSNPIAFGKDADLLLFLQRVRDESHRLAVSFHRRRRGKASLRSLLDDIPGVGPQRKKALIQRFGSMAALRRATGDEMAAVPGIGPERAAQIVRALSAQEEK